MSERNLAATDQKGKRGKRTKRLVFGGRAGMGWDGMGGEGGWGVGGGALFLKWETGFGPLQPGSLPKTRGRQTWTSVL